MLWLLHRIKRQKISVAVHLPENLTNQLNHPHLFEIKALSLKITCNFSSSFSTKKEQISRVGSD